MDTVVMGIGNVLWADEGFGVRAVAALNEGWRFPEAVTLMDGGTQGLYLLPYVQEARRILVFDAIDYGLDPGTLQVAKDGDIPSYLGVGKISLHQTSFQEVLSFAQLSGRAPEHAALVGVQPPEFHFLPDDSLDKAARVEALFRELGKGEGNKE